MSSRHSLSPAGHDVGKPGVGVTIGVMSQCSGHSSGGLTKRLSPVIGRDTADVI